MASITEFQAGYCTHLACVALKGAGFHSCKFPARAYLLQANGKYWLFDTGYAEHFYNATAQGIFSIYRKVTPVYFDNQQAISRQLKNIGLHERDLNGLIISHFHGDHIAGLRDFRRTKYIYSGTGWQQLKKFTGWAALKRGYVPALIPPYFEQLSTPIEAFTKCVLPAELSILGHAYVLPEAAGEILLVDLPGHALGHIGALVKCATGWCLLAADAAWSVTSYRDLIGPSRLANFIMADKQQYYETLAKLQQLHQNNIKIYLSHEGAL